MNDYEDFEPTIDMVEKVLKKSPNEWFTVNDLILVIPDRSPGSLRNACKGLCHRSLAIMKRKQHYNNSVYYFKWRVEK